MTDDAPEGFLGRWSRVKRITERDLPEPEPDLDPASGVAVGPAPGIGAQPEAQACALSDEELEALPRIEDLVPGSDIRAFLRAGVPRPLRNAAMRRMWMLTSAIRDYRDPAVDYAWDWNTPGGVPGDGLPPSPERAAQMLKSLLAPRESAASPEASDQVGDAAEPTKMAVPSADRREDPDGPSAPTRVSGASGSVAAATVETPPTPATTAADLATPASRAESASGPDVAPRRRHGSALPDCP